MTDRMTAADYQKTRAKPVYREDLIQIEIVDWLRKVLPDGCLVHFCKGEIKRGGATFAREQDKATKMGAIKGWPDLIVVTYSGVLFLEVKAPKGQVRDTQKQAIAELEHLGYRVDVVRSVEDVRACLVRWNIGFVDTIEFRGVVR